MRGPSGLIPGCVRSRKGMGDLLRPGRDDRRGDRPPRESRLVLIHGISGSGKSSLVRAGVLPKLALQYRRHDAPWLTCAMRPSGGPLWNLAAEFAGLEGRAGDLERIAAIAGRFNARSATPRLGRRLARRGPGQEPLPARRPVRGTVPLREGDQPRRGGAVRRSHPARGERRRGKKARRTASTCT